MSDTTDCAIISVIVVGLIFFLLFIKGSIALKSDWNNVRCNPVNLFLKSINTDPKESVDEFSYCVNKFNTENEVAKENAKAKAKA